MELLGKDEEVWLWRRSVTRAGCEVSKPFFYPQSSLLPASGLRCELSDVLASTGSAHIEAQTDTSIPPSDSAVYAKHFTPLYPTMPLLHNYGPSRTLTLCVSQGSLREQS